MKQREIKLDTTKYAIKCPYSMSPQYIVIHNTANDASAENEIRYMQSNDREVSFHYAVDDKEAVLGIPLNRNAWHAGDGAKGKGNRYGIAIEICYSKSGGARFSKAEENAAKLTAELLKKYGWSIERVTKHQDYSGKYCPHRTLDDGWERFIKMVDKHLANSNNTSQAVSERLVSYEKNGITFTKADGFRIVYHDKDKRNGGLSRYTNGGFFAYYKSESGEGFTLPVGNLVCDIADVPSLAKQYLKKYISNGKLNYPISANASAQFKGRTVSTLIVDSSGKAYIKKLSSIPVGTKYAVSGLPVVVDGRATTWAEVQSEGWDNSTTYGTSRNLVGIRDGEMWIMTVKTYTSNYIKSGEVWKKIQSEGFTDVIALDGGGSYIRVENGKRRSSGGSRSVNNIIAF